MNDERFFRAAGFLFTWSRVRDRSSTRLDMWIEDPRDGARHWVTTARVASDRREKLYAMALALVAQIQALEVPRRREPQAQAVAWGVALVRDRMQRLDEAAADATWRARRSNAA